MGRGLSRIASAAAVVVALLSLLYAVFYLVVTPSAQRGTSADALFRSYVAHPTGLRVASLCLFVSGVLTTLVYAALRAMPGSLSESMRTWAFALGTVAGVATSVHGLADLIGLDKLAHAYVAGDATTQAAVVVAHAAPAAVDPRGFATFGLVGIVVFVFSWNLRGRAATSQRWVPTLGLVLGVDMVLLFLASAFASTVPILITGGLASVVLGPAWWIGVGGLIAREDGGLIAREDGGAAHA
jgi:hypothetical protein